MATVTTTNGNGDFLSFYLSNPDPNVSIASLSAGPEKLKPRTPTAVVSSYSTTTRKGLSKKEKKRVQWERNLPLLLICSLNLQQWDFGSIGSSGFHFCCVFRFGYVDFSAFIFFFFFTGFDGHGGIVVVQWFLWDWWLLWWCVGSWIKYYFIVDVFVDSVIYYFIVMFILFYCVKS